MSNKSEVLQVPSIFVELFTSAEPTRMLRNWIIFTFQNKEFNHWWNFVRPIGPSLIWHWILAGIICGSSRAVRLVLLFRWGMTGYYVRERDNIGKTQGTLSCVGARVSSPWSIRSHPKLQCLAIDYWLAVYLLSGGVEMDKIGHGIVPSFLAPRPSIFLDLPTFSDLLLFLRMSALLVARCETWARLSNCISRTKGLIGCHSVMILAIMHCL